MLAREKLRNICIILKSIHVVSTKVHMIFLTGFVVGGSISDMKKSFREEVSSKLNRLIEDAMVDEEPFVRSLENKEDLLDWLEAKMGEAVVAGVSAARSGIEKAAFARRKRNQLAAVGAAQ
jgi:hypothetical protein